MSKQQHIIHQPSNYQVKYMATCWVLLFTLIGCSVNKQLPEGEIFYNGASIKITSDTVKVTKPKVLAAELKSLLRPKPNTKFLGRRQKVWYYYAAGEVNKDKGFKHWMKFKLGQPPVYMSDVNPERNITIIENYLENNGYFFAKAVSDSVWGKTQGKVTYSVTPGHRYYINEVNFPTDSGRAAELIRNSAVESFLKKGNPYSFETLKNERGRVDEWIKNRGYYLFNADYLLMRVDTTIENHLANVNVTIKRATPTNALKPWSINNIYIFPNYVAANDSIRDDSTWWHKSYFVVDPQGAYKPALFDEVISFEPNGIYNRDDHNKTLSRLVNIGTFRFVKNNFEELTLEGDTGKLNAHYFLYSSKRRNLRLETTGKTSSANLAGLEVNLNWRNRNLFRGAEQLMLKLYSGFDIQFAGQNKGYNIYHVGVEGSISWPRLVPFHFSPKGSFVPYTRFSISNEWQRRQKLYTVNTLKTGYAWAWRPTIQKEHYFAPITATFVNNRDVSQEYLDQIAKDSSLARVIEEQLIIGPEYTFTYNSTISPKKANGLYFKWDVNLSNNLLGLIQGADIKAGNEKSLLTVPYSQFIKMEQEFRYYRKLSATTTDKQWVNRINFGLGIPYGNSLQLPYIKQFFTGGANSLRAFRVRSVGPGTYRPIVNTDGFIPDLVGDIKLEVNSEFRTKLYGLLHGAAFVDAGNIWLFNDNPALPGGKFTKEFINQLAIGAGIGLRFDIASIFMIRLDWGIPLRKPWLPDGEQWVIDQIQPWSFSWRKENLVTNLAVGLPF